MILLCILQLDHLSALIRDEQRPAFHFHNHHFGGIFLDNIKPNIGYVNSFTT